MAANEDRFWEEVTAPDAEPIDYGQVVREARKARKGVDYWLSELVNKTIVILGISMRSRVITAMVDGRIVRVGFRGKVVERQLREIYDIMQVKKRPVRVKVTLRATQDGRSYVYLA